MRIYISLLSLLTVAIISPALSQDAEVLHVFNGYWVSMGPADLGVTVAFSKVGLNNIEASFPAPLGKVKIVSAEGHAGSDFKISGTVSGVPFNCYYSLHTFNKKTMLWILNDGDGSICLKTNSWQVPDEVEKSDGSPPKVVTLENETKLTPANINTLEKPVVTTEQWVWYGNPDERKFYLENGDSRTPKVGDFIVADDAVNIRSGYIKFYNNSGWVNDPKVGYAAVGDRFRVIKVKTVASGFLWFQVERA